jgi:hypothetical protein
MERVPKTQAPQVRMTLQLAIRDNNMIMVFKDGGAARCNSLCIYQRGGFVPNVT